MKQALVVVVLSLLVLSISLAQAQDRGLFVTLAPGETSPAKPAWLYMIGINQYRHIQKLQTPVADVKSVRNLLLEKFQFDRTRLVERYDGEATRERILNDLYELAGKLGKNDSLFIYYAGHGIEDRRLGQGFWVPVDGKAGNIATMISNGDIRMALSGIPARHIWLVSDSCFSGSLLADRAVPDRIDDRYYREKYKLPSRMILTSGGKEPVADQSGSRDCEGHSVFACYFLKSLRGSEQPYLTPNEIFTAVARNVSNNSDQTPVLGALKQAGDEGGEFVLIARASVPQAGERVEVDLGGSSSGNVAYVPPDTSDYDKLLKDAERQEAKSKKTEEARRQYLAALDTAWSKVKAIADKTAVAKEKRIAVVRKFLSEFPSDNPRQSEAEGLIREIGQERAPEPASVATLGSSTSGGDTWRDPQSGLTWQVTPPSNTMNWADAKSYCSNLSLGGYSDWRLPSIDELRSLIRGCAATQSGGICNIGGNSLSWGGRSNSCDGCSNKGGPGADGMYWPRELKGQCCWYWSSSPVADFDNFAWYVYFSYGLVSNVGMSIGINVRCVR